MSVSRHRSRNLRLWRVALASPLAGPSLVFAQQAPEAVPGLTSGHFLQGVLGLAAVIAVLLLAAWLVKRLGGATPWGQSGALKVVGGVSVGPHERIVLIEVGETWLVVGVTASQVRTLHTLRKGELPDDTMASPPFSRWLKDVVDRRNHEA